MTVLVDLFEDVVEAIAELRRDFFVGLLNLHFEVEPDKFAHVTMCVTILSTKHVADFKHFEQV